MYVIGIGKTKFGKTDKTLPELMHEVILKALKDSPIKAKDVEAVFVANFLGGPNESQLHLGSVVSSIFSNLNLPIIRIEAACASGGSAIFQAILSLSKFNNVLVVGAEKLSGQDTFLNTKNIAMAGDYELDQKEGLIFPGSYALVAQQYMSKYGLTHKDLELVAFKNHKNANLNPLAQFYTKEVALEDIKKAPMVCSPLTLYDCSPFSDGAAAVVLSNKKRSKRDIKVIGSGLATDSISLAQRDDLTSFKATKKAAKEAFRQAKIKPQDINVAEVHDCFTIGEVLAIEDLGIAQKGKAKELIRNGKTKIGGKIPINPSGGLKACGHPTGATGVSQICEITKQLRGEAHKHQVENAKIGLAHNVGGVGGTAAVHILRREK